MAAPRPIRQSQIGFEEEALDDPELERMLDDRQTAKEALKPYRRDYNACHAMVKVALEKAELTNGTYRIGDFVVKIGDAEGKEISFERASRKTYSISVAKT